MAEWLGGGLQILIRRFESGPVLPAIGGGEVLRTPQPWLPHPYAPLAQPAEAPGSKSGQCRFESYRGYDRRRYRSGLLLGLISPVFVVRLHVPLLVRSSGDRASA